MKFQRDFVVFLNSLLIFNFWYYFQLKNSDIYKKKWKNLKSLVFLHDYVLIKHVYYLRVFGNARILVTHNFV